jgi:hypothetical protein
VMPITVEGDEKSELGGRCSKRIRWRAPERSHSSQNRG